jgi:hypothetical protein
MEVIRDLIRDLVGIIFPGSFTVFTALCFLISLLFLFFPESVGEIFAFTSSSGALFIFLVFSYIAGQSLRLKQLGDVEDQCTELYRKSLRKKGISNDEYEKSVIMVREEEEAYSAGQSSREKLTKVFDKHIDRYGLWETFPYPMYLKWTRLRCDTKNYYDFIEKYEKQGIVAKQAFLGFCQMAVYEYSASLKEELLRQEALIRLFAGMFYALIFARIVSLITIILHSIALLLFETTSFLPYLQYKSNARISLIIMIVSSLAYFVFRYLKNEILKRLRAMRVKEVRMVYAGFYLVSTKHNLDH